MTTRHRRAVPASVTLDDKVGRDEQNYVFWAGWLVEFREQLEARRVERRLGERRRATT